MSPLDPEPVCLRASTLIRSRLVANRFRNGDLSEPKTKTEFSPGSGSVLETNVAVGSASVNVCVEALLEIKSFVWECIGAAVPAASGAIFSVSAAGGDSARGAGMFYGIRYSLVCVPAPVSVLVNVGRMHVLS